MFMYVVVKYSLSYKKVCVKGFSKKFSENPKKFSTKNRYVYHVPGPVFHAISL